MNNLTEACRAAGKLELALPLYEDTLRLRKAKLGPEHPHTLTSMGNLGKVYADAGQGEKAATTLAAFVAGWRKRLPPGGREFANVQANVAADLLKCGQHAAAEEMLRECVAIRQQTQPDAWNTFNAQSLLGGALLGQQKHAEAEPLLLKGYEGMRDRAQTIPLQGHSNLPAAVGRLIELYTAANRPDEAKKWRAERAKYPAGDSPSREKK